MLFCPYPHCNHTTPLSEAGVHGLIPNEPMASHVRMIHDSQKMCENCEEGDKLRPNKCSLYCQQCNAHLCKACSDQLHTQKVNRNHTLVNALKKHAIVVRTCRVHRGERVQYFCHECNEAVCSHCLLKGPHQNHKSIDIQTECQKVRQGVSELIHGARMQQQNLGAAHVHLDQVINESESRLHAELASLEQHFEQLHVALANRKQAMHEQLRLTRDFRVNSLREQQMQIERHIQCLHDGWTTVEHLMSLCDIDGSLLFTIQAQLQNKLLTIVQYDVPIHPTDEAFAAAHFDDSLKLHISQYGDVSGVRAGSSAPQAPPQPSQPSTQQQPQQVPPVHSASMAALTTAQQHALVANTTTSMPISVSSATSATPLAAIQPPPVSMTPSLPGGPKPQRASQGSFFSEGMSTLNRGNTAGPPPPGYFGKSDAFAFGSIPWQTDQQS